VTTTVTAGKERGAAPAADEGVETLTSSDEWVRYLDGRSRLHRFSFGDMLLIKGSRKSGHRIQHTAQQIIAGLGIYVEGAS
jgi:hypothetical protein